MQEIKGPTPPPLTRAMAVATDLSCEHSKTDFFCLSTTIYSEVSPDVIRSKWSQLEVGGYSNHCKSQGYGTLSDNRDFHKIITVLVRDDLFFTKTLTLAVFFYSIIQVSASLLLRLSATVAT